LALMGLIGLPAAAVSLWLGPWLGGRFGKKQTIIALYGLWLLTATVPIALRLVNLMPPNGSPALLPILVGNFGLSLALAMSCHINIGSCVADSIDDIAVRTGQRSEGLMFAAYSVLDKCANGGGAFVAGAVLSIIHFPVSALPGTVDPRILNEMAYVKLPIIVVFNLTSMWFFTRYNLSRADHERNAAELARRRLAAPEPPLPDAAIAARSAA
jgi:GPH family glycoside/pentoside/hexuronide:cation symporter